MVKLHNHLLGHSQPVAQAQRLLIPGLRLLKQVLRMVNRAQGVENIGGRRFIPVLFGHFPGAVIPVARLIILKPQVGRGTQGPEIFDHFFVVGQALVNVQRPGIPLFGGAVLPLLVAHLPDGKAGVGDGFLVIAAVNNLQPFFQPLRSGIVAAPPGGNQSVLVIHGGGARVGLAIGLFQQIVQQLPVERIGPVQVHQFY